MDPLQNDAEVEGLAQRSALFRAARAALRAVDASAGSSAFVRALPRQTPQRSIGVVLVIAGLTHGALEVFLPAAAAPAGRYLFAIAAAGVGAVLLALSRSR